MARYGIALFFMLLAAATVLSEPVRALPQTNRNMTVTQYCATCHRFDGNYAQHTKHAGADRLKCADCHPRIPAAIAGTGDVHDPDLFASHAQAAKASRIDHACRKCHWRKSRREIRAVLGKWEQTIYWVRE